MSAESRLRLLYVLDTLSAEAGGPARSVPGLAEAMLAETDVALTLLCGPSPNPVVVSATLAEHVQQLKHVPGFLPSRGLAELRRAYITWRDNHNHSEPGTPLVHLQHLWSPLVHHVARWARRDGIAYVVSTRGMLAPWALRQKRCKKRLALWLYQRRDLRGAAVIHGTAPKERDEATSLLGNTTTCPPVVVVPNGVAAPAQVFHETRGDQASGDNNDAGSSNSNPSSRTALFLSRLHPKKGLADLLAAWQRLRPPGWRLLVAGPDENGERAVQQTYAETHGLTDTVHFLGAVDDHEKWRLYAQADLFVLPTHGENFGLVIAEALAAGLPVITTQEAPWQAIEEHNLGWWIPNQAAALDNALKEATTTTSSTQRHAMGKRASHYIQEHYGWPRITADMLKLYQQAAAATTSR